VYALLPGPLGRMLVAATSRGICAVAFGEDDLALEAGLRAEYPAARISRGDGTGDPDDFIVETPRRGVSTTPGALLERAAAALQAYLLTGRLEPGLPLDVEATPFQLRVWEELRRIPAGQTRSYAQVAQALGQPRAVRAVANACGANPTAVVTPCHRVVRSDGSPGGYRWGLERKKALLQKETI
jgi:AraC family transcriptional regulator of adaptative response/methylated-DNA-[protein]-cysteine methyltransferase